MEATSCGDCVSPGSNCYWCPLEHQIPADQTQAPTAPVTTTADVYLDLDDNESSSTSGTVPSSTSGHVASSATFTSGTSAAETTPVPNQQCFEVGSLGNDCPRCSSMDECKMRTCIVDSKLLYIIVGSVGGGVLLILGIWIWCCCRKRKKRNLKTWQAKESKKEAKKRAAREERQEARRNERSDRTNAIRDKYNLRKNNDDDDVLIDSDMQDYAGDLDYNDGW